MTSDFNHRILLVDDKPEIHVDYRKILAASQARAETELGSGARPSRTGVKAVNFEIDSAYQGREALEKVLQSLTDERPYAMAFVDMHMPPGWDGLETIEHLWHADPDLQIVICTACDFSWKTMRSKLGVNDNLLILKKPFDTIEVVQLAHAMTRKWYVTQQAGSRLEILDKMVSERTRDLQKVNAELRRTEERCTKAFLASPAPLAIQNAGDQRFVDINDAFLVLTGFSRAELIGKTAAELGWTLEYSATAMEALQAGRAIREEDAKVGTKSGEIRQAQLWAERIVIGSEPHVLLMLQDVSERLRIAAQFRQTQKMEAFGQVAAGIAHDFNNLLTIIEGHASLQLSAGSVAPDLASALQYIAQAADRAAHLTRQLLSFNRRRVIRPRPLQINELVENVMAMLRRVVGDGIQLSREIVEDLPKVHADQASIEQILVNLAMNAREAMPNGGRLVISTSGEHFDDADDTLNSDAVLGDYVCLSVADNGAGMSDEKRDEIFDRILTATEPGEDAGMGLAAACSIARQHKGWIDLESAPGEGTTFFVYIPVDTQPAEVPAPLAAASPASAGLRTVLIVENDAEVRHLVKEVLKERSYQVIEAESADDALQLWPLHRDEISLLLTDIVMPGSANGLELAEFLLGDKPALKVIYTSGHSGDLNMNVQLEEGENYLPKPYTASKLATILQHALESSDLAAV